MTEDLTLDEKIENLKKTTDLVNSLPDDFTLKNGWTTKELAIHLWSWDNELMKLCEDKINDQCDDFQFDHDIQGMDYSKWNDYILGEKGDMSLKEARALFKKNRVKLIETFEKLVSIPEKYDEKNFRNSARIMDIWQHDKMHLEAGGLQIDF